MKNKIFFWGALMIGTLVFCQNLILATEDPDAGKPWTLVHQDSLKDLSLKFQRLGWTMDSNEEMSFIPPQRIGGRSPLISEVAQATGLHLLPLAINNENEKKSSLKRIWIEIDASNTALKNEDILRINRGSPEGIKLHFRGEGSLALEIDPKAPDMEEKVAQVTKNLQETTKDATQDIRNLPVKKVRFTFYEKK